MSVSSPLDPRLLLLTGFEGVEAMSELYRFTVDLVAENARAKEVAFDKLLGSELTVTMAMAGGGRCHLSGICSQFEQGNQNEDFTAYQAVIVPRLWLLTRRAQSRIFQQASVPDILERVLEGLDVEYVFTHHHERREYCVQYRETDFAFVSRLMEEEGMFYFFEHREGGHTLVIADSNNVHKSVPGLQRVRFDVVEQPNSPGVHIREWRKRQQIRSGKVELWDTSFQLPGKNLAGHGRTSTEMLQVGGTSHSLNVAGSDALEIYDYPGGYAKRFDGINSGGGSQTDELRKIHEYNERTARLRMAAETSTAITAEGVSNCNHFVTGHDFALERHFDASGHYVLLSIHHEAKCAEEYRSGGSSAFDYKNRFTCIPAAVDYKPACRTPKPVIPGVQTAFVVGPPGEEIHIDKFARVKVQFHWDREGRRDDRSSCWVRVSQAWAGIGFGGVNHPRIGQEVIVDFEDGDPDRPIITGRVYNAGSMPHNSNAGRDGKPGNTPPANAPAAKMMTSFKSGSTPGGGGYNEITMNDTKGAEGLFLKAQKDEIHNVGNDREDTVGNNEITSVGVDRTDTVGSNETRTIGVNMTESVGVNQTTTVGQNIVITAGTSITLKCGASTIHMNQAGFITVSGTVISTAASVNASVVAPMTEVVGGALLTLAGAVVLEKGGVVRIDGSSLMHVGGGTVEVIGGETVIQGAPVKVN